MGILQRKLASAASSFARIDGKSTEQTISTTESVLHSITLTGDTFAGTLTISDGAAATVANILTILEIGIGESETFLFSDTFTNGIRVTAENNVSYTGNGVSDLDFLITANTITRVGGSFITDGFVVGQEINVTGTVSNNGIKTINTVTALVLTVDEALVTESNVAATLDTSRLDALIIYDAG